VEVEGRRRPSLGAGEKLRLDVVWNDDVKEAESGYVVVFWVTGLWLVEGRRGSGSATGEVERERGGEARRLVGITFIDRRWASSAFRSLLAVVIGSRLATEAERCWTVGRSTGER
jgi:hypothetical protein